MPDKAASNINGTPLPSLADRALAVIAHAALVIIRLIPLDTASAFGGWLGRHIGPHFGVTRIARKNLQMAFPEKTADEIEAIIRGMWDNLGRSFFEFAHLDRFRFTGPNPHVEIVGAEFIDQLRDDDLAGIFVSGHLANWEIMVRGVHSRNLDLHLIYRAPNNPLMENLFARRLPGKGELLKKGRAGAKRALQLLKSNEHLGMLVDQKMNDGIAVPFFGRDAMTAPAVAQFAYRMGCPVVPVQAERLGSARFRITYHPPMVLPRSDDQHADILQTMTDINALLESWIRQRPEQWLWVHRRWPSE